MTETEPDRNRDPSVPPPTSTDWSQENADEGGELPLPPFFVGAQEPAPMTPAEPEAEAPDEEEPWAVGTPMEEEPEDDRSFPFEYVGGTGEEPEAEEASLRETVAASEALPFLDAEEAPAYEVPEPEPLDDLPVEPYHLPEPGYGAAPSTAPPDRTSVRALDLADRLDRLAGALRARGTAALTDQLAGGDRFDALLTGLLAGFLAAGND